MQIISSSSSTLSGHIGCPAFQRAWPCSTASELQVPAEAYIIVQGHLVENDKPGLFVLEAAAGCAGCWGCAHGVPECPAKEGVLEALKADRHEDGSFEHAAKCCTC